MGQLAADHETVGELLNELRRVTAGYATPVDGCATYAACYRALAELEADAHLHVHKESNVLIPARRTEIFRRAGAFDYGFAENGGYGFAGKTG